MKQHGPSLFPLLLLSFRIKKGRIQVSRDQRKETHINSKSCLAPRRGEKKEKEGKRKRKKPKQRRHKTAKSASSFSRPLLTSRQVIFPTLKPVTSWESDLLQVHLGQVVVDEVVALLIQGNEPLVVLHNSVDEVVSLVLRDSIHKGQPPATPFNT